MKRVTIKDIAAKLGVSICTVNKALTGKPRVGEETRLRVIEEAQRMGYKPNSLARTLSRPELRIAAVFPDAWPSYIMRLFDGVKERLSELSDYRVEASYVAVPGFNDGLAFLRALQRLSSGRADGMILCLGDYPKPQLDMIWSFLSGSRVPYVLLGGRPGEGASSRLTCVWPDCRLGGRLASDLLDLTCRAGSQRAIFIGRKEHPDHRFKIQGFAEGSLHRGGPQPEICEAFDDPTKAYPAAKALFKRRPETSGLYIGTENAEGVLRYVREAGLAGKLKIVATGTSEPVVEALREGLVSATLDQRQEEQGRNAVSALFEYLETGARPDPELFLKPYVLLRSNLD